MIKIVFFVPVSHLEAVKDAVFAAGAGRIGSYDSCCWQTPGIGQFRPTEGSTPFVGYVGDLERVDEYRVELVCTDEHALSAVDALIDAHPYETPAYETYRVWDRAQLANTLRGDAPTQARTAAGNAGGAEG